jgi:hypothetical protein
VAFALSYWKRRAKIHHHAANSTTESAFETEARRQGRLLLHHQRLYVPLGLAIVLLGTAIFLACAFLVPLKHSYLLMCLWLGDALAMIIGMNELLVYAAWRLRRYLTVPCPTCNGTARFEPAPLPDTHVYLVCPQCHQRADTGFVVPYNPRLGGRVSLYDWHADKKPGPKHSITVHLRRPVQKGQKKRKEKGEGV